MIPVSTSECNHEYHLSGKPDEGRMPCKLDVEAGTVRSFWRPADDDEIITGQAIYVRVVGSISPVKVGLWRNGVATMEQVKLERWDDGGGVCAAHFDSDVIEHFLRGGCFCLEVMQIPPYPVSVWIDKITV